jgi:hypothetical protein
LDGKRTVRIPIGLTLATCCLAGCSGGALDVGESDGGDDRSAVPVAEVTVFSKASVENASQLCTVSRNNSALILGSLKSLWTSYPEAALRSDLAKGWLVCFGAAPDGDKRSFQFTADGHWYTLVDDGNGGLKRGQVAGDAGGQIGYNGTYTFRDSSNNPSEPDGSAVYVATAGARWFHPEFVGPVMSMYWATDGANLSCVVIDP